MGIEGIMVRSFAQFGVVQTDYDMTRLLTENALLRQPGGIQEAAPISPDILTPEGRESYAQIALLVRQAARRLREEQERTLRQEAAEQARAEREEERRREQRQEQWEDDRRPQEATAAMTRDETAQEAAGQADSQTGQDGDTYGDRAPDAEDISPLPAGRTHGDPRSPSASRTERIAARTAGQATERTAGNAAGHAAGRTAGQAAALMAAQTDAAADGLSPAGRTGSPTLLHLTI